MNLIMLRCTQALCLGRTRRRCIEQLKEIGYQVGCGFMVGSPGQTWEHLAEDLLYIRNLEPHMVGIGPFIPQHDTPFAASSCWVG